MNALIKFPLVLVLSISLLFLCSLFFLSAEALVPLQKLNLEDNLIRIQTSSGNPVLDIQLRENTDQCLVNCHAIFKIHPYQDIVLPNEHNSEFNWNFVKEQPWMDGITSHHFEIRETSEYKVEIPEYGKKLVKTICYNEENTSSYECEVEQTVQTGSHVETRFKHVYKPFNFWGETLKANQDYTIKLVGKKRPQTGENNVDWLPTIKGFELKEWEWWNSSWVKCKNITIIGDSIGRVNEPVTANLTDLIFSNSTSEVIIVNTSCNDGGNEAEQRQHMNGTDWVWTTFVVDEVPASTNVTYSVYYDNTQATEHYDMLDFYDAWNITYNGTGYPNATGSEWFRLDHMDEGTQWLVTTDVVDMGHERLRLQTFHDEGSGNPYWYGEDYVLFYGSGGTSSKTQGTIEGIWRVVSAGTDKKVYHSMIGMEGFGGTPKRYIIGLNTTSVNRYADSYGEAGWSAPNTTYHHIRLTAASPDTAEVYLNGEYKGNVTSEAVGAYYRSLFGDGASSGNGGTDLYWSWVAFNSTDYLPLLNITIGSEEEMPCPSDDTYINENTEYAEIFCNVADGGSTGALIINASNLIVDCDGMTLNGSGSGVGIYNRGFHNVTLKECKVQNYESDIKFNNELIADVKSAASVYE